MAQPGLATASRESADGAPDPIEHASPDVELAEAQLALGRPELAEDSAAVPADAEEPAREEEIGEAPEIPGVHGPEVPGLLPPRAQVQRGGADIAGAELDRVEAPVPPGRSRPGSRLVNFLQGSWRELQRVQWPDRRQVMQATGVVIGFVIVAGVFLGVADLVAGKLVNLILK